MHPCPALQSKIQELQVQNLEQAAATVRLAGGRHAAGWDEPRWRKPWMGRGERVRCELERWCWGATAGAGQEKGPGKGASKSQMCLAVCSHCASLAAGARCLAEGGPGSSRAQHLQPRAAPPAQVLERCVLLPGASPSENISHKKDVLKPATSCCSPPPDGCKLGAWPMDVLRVHKCGTKMCQNPMAHLGTTLTTLGYDGNSWVEALVWSI